MKNPLNPNNEYPAQYPELYIAFTALNATIFKDWFKWIYPKSKANGHEIRFFIRAISLIAGFASIAFGLLYVITDDPMPGIIAGPLLGLSILCVFINTVIELIDSKRLKHNENKLKSFYESLQAEDVKEVIRCLRDFNEKSRIASVIEMPVPKQIAKKWVMDPSPINTYIALEFLFSHTETLEYPSYFSAKEKHLITSYKCYLWEYRLKATSHEKALDIESRLNAI